MKSTEALLLKIENTKEFNCIVVSDDRDAASLLFPKNHQRLQRFKNVTLIKSYFDLFAIYASNKNKKLVVFIDVTSRDPTSELRELIYSIHSEQRGILFGFTF